MFSAHSFGITEPEYPDGADKNLLVIVQIESQQGVDNVEEIAAVEGLDVLFVGECFALSVRHNKLIIGPYDLSKFMNVEFGGEKHEAAIAKVLEAAHKNGKIAAIFCKSNALTRDVLTLRFIRRHCQKETGSRIRHGLNSYRYRICRCRV